MNYRHHANKNLTIHNQPDYNGLSIYHGAPLADNYLDSINNTFHKAFSKHPRIFAVRVDLHFPPLLNGADYPVDYKNRITMKFIDSFKAKLKASEHRKVVKGQRVHKCKVHYIWVRERNEACQDHFHFFLLLNNDTYNNLGSYTVFGDNTTTRIVEAWASALQLEPHVTKGLVHFPIKNPVYFLDCNADTFCDDYAEAFERASYLAKLTTKHYGDGSNAFGCSRS